MAQKLRLFAFFCLQKHIQHLVVHQEGAVAVLQRGVRVQDGVVRLHDGRGHLGCRVDGELAT